MNIPKEQIVGKPRKIGTLHGDDVMELDVVGGLHLVFAVGEGGKTKTLGLGSHKTIARHVAKKQNPDLEISELNKSETLPVWLVEQLTKNEDAEGLTAATQAIEAELAG